MAKTVALLFLATANPVVSLSLPRAKTFSMEDRRSFTNKVCRKEVEFGNNLIRTMTGCDVCVSRCLLRGQA